jgi:hypothetical protein
VGVVGGSVAGGVTKFAGEELVKALQKAPRFKDKKIELVNLGIGGFKQPQQLMMLNYMLAAGGEFDIIINIDGFNEVALHPAENAQKHVSHLYPREWAARIERERDPGELRLRGDLTLLSARRRERAREFGARPLAWSMTANLIWQIVDVRSAAELGELRSRILAYKTTAPVLGPPEPYIDDAGMYDALAALWKRTSIQLDRVCRANGISYYHFLQPNQYVEGSKPMGEKERAVAYKPDQPYSIGVRRGYPLLQHAGAELSKTGVHFRDLTMLFAAHEEPLYLDDCCHYNQLGCNLVARTIGEAIVENSP